MNTYGPGLYDAIFEVQDYKCIGFVADQDAYQATMVKRSSGQDEIIDFIHAGWNDVFVCTCKVEVDSQAIRLYTLSHWDQADIDDILCDFEDRYTCSLDDTKSIMIIKPIK